MAEALVARKYPPVTRLRVSEAEYVRPPGVAEGSIVSVFRVPPEVAGMRLDVFLQSQLRRTSRTRTQYIVRMSAYDDRGRRMKSNDRVRAEQQILLWRAPWDETPVPTVIPVVYEDDHLLAVDKPANLPVHPTARYHKNTLIKLLQAERPGEFLRLGHRIDRETSGVLLVAKTAACERALKRQLELRDDIDKRYMAITWGVPEMGARDAVYDEDDAEGGASDARLAGEARANETHERRTFRHVEPLELDPESRYKVKMRSGKTSDALFAATRFRVLGVRRGDDGRVYSLVRCDLETGRQHQIRVHLAGLGAPIVGDKLYGPDESLFARGADGELTEDDATLLELPRHALHARALTLPHPITGERVRIEAPLPGDLATFWGGLE